MAKSKPFTELKPLTANKGNTAYIPLFKTGYRKTPGKNAESINLCSIIAQRRTESDRQGLLMRRKVL
jgi:hypothetical protein